MPYSAGGAQATRTQLQERGAALHKWVEPLVSSAKSNKPSVLSFGMLGEQTSSTQAARLQRTHVQLDTGGWLYKQTYLAQAYRSVTESQQESGRRRFMTQSTVAAQGDDKDGTGFHVNEFYQLAELQQTVGNAEFISCVAGPCYLLEIRRHFGKQSCIRLSVPICDSNKATAIVLPLLPVLDENNKPTASYKVD